MDLSLFGNDPTLSSDVGLGAADGEFVPLLEGGTELPASTTRTFTNYEDDQRSVELRIRAADERGLTKLGNVILDEIPRAPARTLEIKVTFAVNEAGRLRIAASSEDPEYQQTVVVDLDDECLE